MLKRIFLIALVQLIALFISPAVADAQVLQCEVTGVMVIIAINGPVTVCSVDTTTSDPIQVGPLNVSPQHLFLPAPPPEQ
jgi:hypothetical protein